MRRVLPRRGPSCRRLLASKSGGIHRTHNNLRVAPMAPEQETVQSKYAREGMSLGAEIRNANVAVDTETYAKMRHIERATAEQRLGGGSVPLAQKDVKKLRREFLLSAASDDMAAAETMQLLAENKKNLALTALCKEIENLDDLATAARVRQVLKAARLGGRSGSRWAKVLIEHTQMDETSHPHTMRVLLKFQVSSFCAFRVTRKLIADAEAIYVDYLQRGIFDTDALVELACANLRHGRVDKALMQIADLTSTPALESLRLEPQSLTKMARHLTRALSVVISRIRNEYSLRERQELREHLVRMRHACSEVVREVTRHKHFAGDHARAFFIGLAMEAPLYRATHTTSRRVVRRERECLKFGTELIDEGMEPREVIQRVSEDMLDMADPAIMAEQIDLALLMLTLTRDAHVPLEARDVRPLIRVLPRAAVAATPGLAGTDLLWPHEDSFDFTDAALKDRRVRDASSDTTSSGTASNDTASDDTASDDTASADTASNDAASDDHATSDSASSDITTVNDNAGEKESTHNARVSVCARVLRSTTDLVTVLRDMRFVPNNARALESLWAALVALPPDAKVVSDSFASDRSDMTLVALRAQLNEERTPLQRMLDMVNPYKSDALFLQRLVATAHAASRPEVLTEVLERHGDSTAAEASLALYVALARLQIAQDNKEEASQMLARALSYYATLKPDGITLTQRAAEIALEAATLLLGATHEVTNALMTQLASTGRRGQRKAVLVPTPETRRCMLRHVASQHSVDHMVRMLTKWHTGERHRWCDGMWRAAHTLALADDDEEAAKQVEAMAPQGDSLRLRNARMRWLAQQEKGYVRHAADDEHVDSLDNVMLLRDLDGDDSADSLRARELQRRQQRAESVALRHIQHNKQRLRRFDPYAGLDLLSPHHSQKLRSTVGEAAQDEIDTSRISLDSENNTIQLHPFLE